MTELTGNIFVDILNCVLWIMLTIALIIIMFKMSNAWIEVKNAIRDKIKSQTRGVKK